jgi:transposase InsO family protein
LPVGITVDNGSEFSSRALDAWAIERDVQLYFVRQGKLASFGEHYNHQRPHSALADRGPGSFRRAASAAKEKT